MRMCGVAWKVWVVGGVASFAVLESIGYRQGETLTSQITRWRNGHPLRRPLIAAALGAVSFAALEHLLNHEPSPPDRARMVGL